MSGHSNFGSNAFVKSILTLHLSFISNVFSNPDGNLIVVTNKFETASGYSGNIFDISTAIKSGVVYPSLDPSIFEVKYPDTDIVGKCLGDY